MSERKSHTDIDGKSRETVHIRDGYRCVYCGRTDKPIELAHFIGRARGGKGIPQNLVSLCMDCHRDYDGAKHNSIQPFLEDYLKSQYDDWNEDNLYYRKR